MSQQQLIKQGYTRVVIFVVVFAVLSYLLNVMAGKLIPVAASNQPGSTAARGILNDPYVLFSLLLSVITSFITAWIFCKVVDKRSFSSLGFALHNNRSHAGTGFFLGLAMLGTGTLALVAASYLQWTGISFNATSLFLSLGLLVLVAFAEELVFRGYILGNLLESMKKWVALALSAGLFALFHLGNPGISAVAAVNIFLGGLLLGINYIYTRNLWFGICFHISWNFYQGAILGYPVSGLHFPALLQQDLSGNHLFTGGSFGFEGSLLYTILSLITVLALAWVYERKQNARRPAA